MIQETLKKIGKHSLVYSAGTTIGRVVGFLMVPFYTRFLSPADYGVLGRLDLRTCLLCTVIGLGISGAMVRFFYDCQEEEQRNEIVSTAVLFGLALLSIIYLALRPLSP